MPRAADPDRQRRRPDRLVGVPTTASSPRPARRPSRPSITAAPPVSVLRKSRTGAARLRAHAVRPPKEMAGASALIRPRLSQSRRWLTAPARRAPRSSRRRDRVRVRDQVVAEHPLPVRVPLRLVLPAPRLARRSGRTPAASRGRSRAGASGRARVRAGRGSRPRPAGRGGPTRSRARAPARSAGSGRLVRERRRVARRARARRRSGTPTWSIRITFGCLPRCASWIAS